MWRPGDPKVYNARSLFGPAAFFQALLKVEDIMSRGLQVVLYKMSEGYYKALLLAKSLRPLAAKTEEELRNYSHQHFLDFLRTGILPTAEELAAAPRPPGMAAGAGAAAAAIPADLHDVHGEAVADDLTRPILVQLPGGPALTVHFDKWTHASGVQRAFIACPKANTDHEGCREHYIHVNVEGGRRFAVAGCYVWARLALTTDMGKDAHQSAVLPHADVAEVAAHIEALGLV